MHKYVLVTGGTGYIGSHTAVRLIMSGKNVVVFDNLCNSRADVIDRIRIITEKNVEFVNGDIRDKAALQQLFARYEINEVIHFAGVKAVGEAEQQPLKYYDNNVAGTISLLEAMAAAEVFKIVFSSSATVYGDPGPAQYTEAMPLAPINVYGRTKLAVERILRDLKHADSRWRIAALRYFNPAGAHESGLIGEEPSGIPNNLLPFVAQVASGQRDSLCVFGGDYPTHDGTGCRDYVHVDDLAAAHIAALDALNLDGRMLELNIGSGRAFSVLDLIAAFAKVSGKVIPYEIVARREGDLAEYYADPSLARQVLGWNATLDLERMCRDTWRWQNSDHEVKK